MIRLNPTKALRAAKDKKIVDLKTRRDEACASYEYQGNIFAVIENIWKFFAKDSKKPKIVDFIDESDFRQFKEALFTRKDWIMVHYNQLYAEIESCEAPQQIEDVLIDFSQPE